MAIVELYKYKVTCDTCDRKQIFESVKTIGTPRPAGWKVTFCYFPRRSSLGQSMKEIDQCPECSINKKEVDIPEGVSDVRYKTY